MAGLLPNGIIKYLLIRRLVLGKGKNEFFVVLWKD